MNKIEQLVQALQACGINATMKRCVFTSCDDSKLHDCLMIFTDFYAGDDNLDFMFNPVTERLVYTASQCPVIEEKGRIKKKKNK